MPIKIFFCYAHEDKKLLEKLRKQLKPLERERLIEMWHDGDISAGTERKPVIGERLLTAQIILLLVSPDFIDSDYIYQNEMIQAVERHERREACVIPVILRPIYWQRAPFGKLEALPKEGKPVVGPGWHNQEEALFNIQEGIRIIIEELTKNGSSAQTGPASKPTEVQGQSSLGDQSEVFAYAEARITHNFDEESRAQLLADIQRMIHAEQLLFEADKYPSPLGLMEKEKLVQQAVALWPDLKQRAFRQLGIDMSIAVINGFKPTLPGYGSRLGKNEREWLTQSAMSYLEETVLPTVTPDPEGLLHLACMYGSQGQFDDMLELIDRVITIDEKMQERFQRSKILITLLRSCDTDEMKLKRLSTKLAIAPTTKNFFCDYIKNFHFENFHGFIEWIAVKRPHAKGEPGIFFLKITPPYPVNERKVNASALRVEGGLGETIVAADKLVTIEELFDLANPLFFLICPNCDALPNIV
jgi:hypothetical protein